jgi:hypothetical protein
MSGSGLRKKTLKIFIFSEKDVSSIALEKVRAISGEVSEVKGAVEVSAPPQV